MTVKQYLAIASVGLLSAILTASSAQADPVFQGKDTEQFGDYRIELTRFTDMDNPTHWMFSTLRIMKNDELYDKVEDIPYSLKLQVFDTGTDQPMVYFQRKGWEKGGWGLYRYHLSDKKLDFYQFDAARIAVRDPDKDGQPIIEVYNTPGAYSQNKTYYRWNDYYPRAIPN